MANPSPSSRRCSAPPRLDLRSDSQPYREPAIGYRQLDTVRYALRWPRDLKRYGWLLQNWPGPQYQPVAHSVQTRPAAIDRGCPGTVAACRARWHTSDCASTRDRGNAGGLSAHRTLFHSNERMRLICPTPLPSRLHHGGAPCFALEWSWRSPGAGLVWNNGLHEGPER